MRIKNLLILGSLIIFSTNQMNAATSPSEVNIKVYEVWVSPNADCTNMTRIFSESSPSYQNMVSGPTFGATTVSNGTYQCIAWKMGDLLQFRPVANEGDDCVANTLYTRDLFRAETPALVSVCPDGTNITGTGSMLSPVEDTMCIYMSVNGNNSTGAYDPSHPMLLSSPYIVSGTQNGTMVTDFTNKIIDEGSECDCHPPVFNFR